MLQSCVVVCREGKVKIENGERERERKRNPNNFRSTRGQSGREKERVNIEGSVGWKLEKSGV